MKNRGSEILSFGVQLRGGFSLTKPQEYATANSWSEIRDFPDHATFRKKGAKLDCGDKLVVFLSLTLCIKANFDPQQ